MSCQSASIKSWIARILIFFSVVLTASCESMQHRNTANKVTPIPNHQEKAVTSTKEASPSNNKEKNSIKLPSLPGNYNDALFIGTITHLDNIWVNGVEIKYPDSVRIDSRLPNIQANLAALKLGQQVILKTHNNTTPVTSSIEIYYPFTGQVQNTDGSRIKVNNIWINLNDFTQVDNGLKTTKGSYIAVNAYQDADGKWMATRLSANPQHASWSLPRMLTRFNVTTRTIVMQRGLSKLLEEHQIHMQQLILRGIEQTPAPLGKHRTSKE